MHDGGLEAEARAEEAAMNGATKRHGGRTRARRGPWAGAALLLLVCVWPLGLVLSCHRAALDRGTALSIAPAHPPSRFQVSFARAQHWYLLAQLHANQKLE